MSHKKPNILLVDDHKTTNILNKILLEKTPAITSVRTASNMIEAISIVRKFSPEIILIDKDHIFKSEDIYNEFRELVNNNTLVILLSNNHLCESDNKQINQKIQLPQLKFKVLTKNVVDSILKTYYNNYFMKVSG